MEQFSHTELGLRFTFDINLTQFPFLDVLIFKSDTGDLLIYCKPTAMISLLHWTSSYPMTLK